LCLEREKERDTHFMEDRATESEREKEEEDVVKVK